MLQRLASKTGIPTLIMMPAALWPSLPLEYRKAFLTREEAVDLINEAKSMLNNASEEAEKLRQEIAELENMAPQKIARILSRVNLMEESATAIFRSLVKALSMEHMLEQFKVKEPAHH